MLSKGIKVKTHDNIITIPIPLIVNCEIQELENEWKA